jgi:hypothetical protein
MKKSIWALLLFGCMYSSTAYSQEVRLNGGLMILGYVNDPFAGFGVGIETSVGTHFTFNMDVNWGAQKGGNTVEFRPALHYYTGKQQKGFFVGPALKYISVKEPDESQGEYADNLYALAFNVGVKSSLSERLTLSFLASPHLTVGGSGESDVAGISAQLSVGYEFGKSSE